jgi:hypothetical protein
MPSPPAPYSKPSPVYGCLRYVKTLILFDPTPPVPAPTQPPQTASKNSQAILTPTKLLFPKASYRQQQKLLIYWRTSYRQGGSFGTGS